MSGFTDPDGFSDRMWLDDMDAESGFDDVSDDLLEVYDGEGHLVVLYAARGNQPGESWFGVCSCGEASWGDDELEDRRISRGRTPARLLSYWDIKWWARNHRTAEGLDWQEWWPWRDWWPWACRGMA